MPALNTNMKRRVRFSPDQIHVLQFPCTQGIWYTVDEKDSFKHEADFHLDEGLAELKRADQLIHRINVSLFKDAYDLLIVEFMTVASLALHLLEESGACLRTPERLRRMTVEEAVLCYMKADPGLQFQLDSSVECSSLSEVEHHFHCKWDVDFRFRKLEIVRKKNSTSRQLRASLLAKKRRRQRRHARQQLREDRCRPWRTCPKKPASARRRKTTDGAAGCSKKRGRVLVEPRVEQTVSDVGWQARHSHAAAAAKKRRHALKSSRSKRPRWR